MGMTEVAENITSAFPTLTLLHNTTNAMKVVEELGTRQSTQERGEGRGESRGGYVK